MSDPLTLKQLLEAATPGPWSANNQLFVKADCNGFVVAEVRRPRGRGKEYWEELPYCEANAALIVAAVNALPSLLDELESLQAQVGVLREALEHISSGEAFREMRFAEDDDADYFLRAQRKVQLFARSALSPSPPSALVKGDEA